MGKSGRKLTFEQALSRLDEIVAAMESGEIGIEESITRYEEAMQLAAQCRAIIDRAEQRIKQIQLDHAGQLKVDSFEPQNDEADEPAEAE